MATPMPRQRWQRPSTTSERRAGGGAVIIERARSCEVAEVDSFESFTNTDVSEVTCEITGLDFADDIEMALIATRTQGLWAVDGRLLVDLSDLPGLIGVRRSELPSSCSAVRAGQSIDDLVERPGRVSGEEHVAVRQGSRHASGQRLETL